MRMNLPATLAIATVMLLSTHSASAATLAGRIVSIADGDTVTLLDAGTCASSVRCASSAAADCLISPLASSISFS